MVQPGDLVGAAVIWWGPRSEGAPQPVPYWVPQLCREGATSESRAPEASKSREAGDHFAQQLALTLGGK